MQKKAEEIQNKANIDTSKNAELEKFRFLLGQITEQYINKFEEIQGIKKKEGIPTEIFNDSLSPLETVVKYLKENNGISIKNIASSLNRSPKTIWQAYNQSRKKFSSILKPTSYEFTIPIENICISELSVLESIVTYLRQNYSLSYAKIATLLKRDQRTIWVVFDRARKKQSER
jgi:hypothetical protein